MNRFLHRSDASGSTWLHVAPRSHWKTSTGGSAQSPAVLVAEQALGSTTAPNNDSKTQEGELLHGWQERASIL